MARVPCSACQRRVVGRLTSIYVARFSEQQRVCRRTRLCNACAADYASTIKATKPIRPDESGDAIWPDLCPVCGGVLSEEVIDPIYLTIFEPKQDVRALTLPSCGTCTANLWPLLTVNATLMEDRPSGNGSSPAGQGEGAPSPVPLAWA